MRSEQPIVSISCLTYNHRAFIRDAIEGFLMQDITFPIEILIHDDASTDGTAEIIQEYEVKYPQIFKPIYQKENQYSRGNKPGIINRKRAIGKYIAFCDGDDYWTDPYKLQKQVDFLESNHDYVLCYHDAKIIDHNGALVSNSKMNEESKRDYSADDIIKGHTFILTLSLVFRNIIKEFPPEMNYSPNGDNFLTSLLGNYGRGKFMTDIEPAIYRIHPGGVWSNQNEFVKLNRKINTYYWLHTYYYRLNKIDYSKHFINRIKNLLNSQISQQDKSPVTYNYKHDINLLFLVIKRLIKNVFIGYNKVSLRSNK